MVEKIIQLDGVPLIEFLGIENQNIREIASAFPQSKVLSRGNELRIMGSSPEIIRINDIINALLVHYHKFGKIVLNDVKGYLSHDPEQVLSPEEQGDVIIYGIKGNPIKPRTANQKQLVEAVNKNDLVFALGPAGTGKTYVAVAMAVRALKNKQVRKIVVTRPAVEAGESLGFLPGDLKEKIDPYLRPIYDALEDMIPTERLEFYQEKNIIEIAPLAYMRGRTLNNAFILLDEAQNTTPLQMKMMLTRLGINSKMVITGDESQVDLPRRQKSGLTDSVEILQNTEGIGILRLTEEDVVRHKLVKRIIKAYDKRDKQTHENK
ncbi:MAG: phosphate starvation-inducible protein PhoH [Bacteroidetes bacterium]|nr:MAG: phosphate starvation-inducible protein PhoH [Bacteroidota bacterium]